MLKFAINIRNLSYRYNTSQNWALTNIDLQIPKGSFFTLIGPSGSGKSTLLTLLRGFQQEIGGEIQGSAEVLGKDILSTPIGELGKTVGIVFQNPSLQLHQLRVIDEVASASMYQGIPYDECIKRARNLIDRIIGKEFYESSPTELSSGQQQKVALAASLSLDAEILLLDEPFSFLDKSSDLELIKILLEFNKEGKTIIVSSHDISKIASISTHMGLVAKGKLVMVGKPAKILYSNELKQTMTAPLFVKIAQKIEVDSHPLSWEQLIPQVALKREGLKPTNKGRNKLISIESLSFSYPDSNNGVEDVSFDINKGEIFGLIGSNGSGKTTLAKLLLGLLKPHKGEVRFKDKNISNKSTQKRAKLIGYVTQDPIDMFFEMNVWDEVAAGPKFLDLPYPKKRAEKILKKFNLWQYKEKHPDSISGGEKSLLGIADILVNETPLLLLDEPEFGLDPGNWEYVTQTLLKLKEQGKSIIIITQDLEAAFFLCDRVGVVQHGRLIKVGLPVEIFKDNAFLKESGLLPLGFSPLLSGLSTTIKLTKDSLLEGVNSKV